MALLKAENISVEFGNRPILKDVTISLNSNELVSILGLSGSGKTTLFNVLSGIIKPQTGQVIFNNRDITGHTGYMSYMLQKDLLLSHKSIIDNVSLPLIIQGMSRKDARQKSLPYLKSFGLESSANMYPNQLSGGMRQRAALLRTYMCGKEIALLDEPFSALDTITKSSMHEWYLSIMKEINLSTLFITHDIDEAILLSDRIYILGNTPSSIVEEIVINQNDVRRADLLVSNEFLHYKKTILKAIGDNQ